MREEVQLAAHPELWGATSIRVESRGPEVDLKMWEEAENILDTLCYQHEHSLANDAVQMALVDTYNRCVEERRRAEELLKLRKVWASRRIGGVEEPKSVIAEPPA